MGIDMDFEGIPSFIEIHGNESGGASEGIPGLEDPHIDGLLAINEQYIPIYNPLLWLPRFIVLLRQCAFDFGDAVSL